MGDELEEQVSQDVVPGGQSDGVPFGVRTTAASTELVAKIGQAASARLKPGGEAAPSEATPSIDEMVTAISRAIATTAAIPVLAGAEAAGVAETPSETNPPVPAAEMLGSSLTGGHGPAPGVRAGLVGGSAEPEQTGAAVPGVQTAAQSGDASSDGIQDLLADAEESAEDMVPAVATTEAVLPRWASDIADLFEVGHSSPGDGTSPAAAGDGELAEHVDMAAEQGALPANSAASEDDAAAIKEQVPAPAGTLEFEGPASVSETATEDTPLSGTVAHSSQLNPHLEGVAWTPLAVPQLAGFRGREPQLPGLRSSPEPVQPERGVESLGVAQPTPETVAQQADATDREFGSAGNTAISGTIQAIGSGLTGEVAGGSAEHSAFSLRPGYRADPSLAGSPATPHAPSEGVAAPQASGGAGGAAPDTVDNTTGTVRVIAEAIEAPPAYQKDDSRTGRAEPFSAVRFARRAARLAVLVFAGWLALMAFVILVFRFVDPPGSMLMAGQWLTGTQFQYQWVKLDQVSDNLKRAVVVSEDGRFCQHWGVDPREIVAAIRRARNGTPRGASTITMQVAKNMFLWPSKSYVRKALELPLALMVDLMWSKSRILEVYLNIAEWGPGVFGAEAASQHHFKKPVRKLSQREAALLAVSLPNPIRRDAGDPGRGTLRLANALQARMRSSGQAANCALRGP